ncbi:MAG: type V CRISPR-associated protein Cas4 [Xanthomonadaceae bacterium]|nr:type V CRISPR-associated protein Cas4 [Xanthomonadaceae bacterium]
MEHYLPIAFLNDFIFCPRSIYYHQLYRNYRSSVYKAAPQYKGLHAHKAIDQKRYSSKKSILQGYEVYSEKYRLHGKIDTFDQESGILTERKRAIKTIYDGYIFQLYGQYFCLTEMGFSVEKLQFYDMTHNKVYPVMLPHEDHEMRAKFELLINQINHYDLLDTPFTPLLAKCQNCIYSQLCDRSLC